MSTVHSARSLHANLRTDLVATVAVALGVAAFLLSVTGVLLTGSQGIRVATLVVLVFGFVASASAVVPKFDSLLHGNRVYLAVSSALGVIALAGGVYALVTAEQVGLVALVIATVVLWILATARHVYGDRAA